ncbi:lipase 2 [Diplogelasinospora grovesii]|uniref:Lipase 2 n=1 Tax=Diplogelasinospora grovesii TaxID=303347 RepID=A0AAN6MXQ1_9PEZI|nr:lipase 2 [Diplogelasinospora grovesii]
MPKATGAPLVKTTRAFAVHQVTLECDIFSASDYPKDGLVFLFFHSGGLVCGARSVVPPWLVQTCYQRKWPLLSASYRLLPQVDGPGLLQDAQAAYDFARSLDGQTDRRVVVGGASAGFFMAALIAHHAKPKPAALLSITGIPSFRHPFFNSSTLIPPTPVKEEEVDPFIAEPVSIGNSAFPPAIFYLDCLLPSGSKNPTFEVPDEVLSPGVGQDPSRGMLYDYFLYDNAFLSMVGSVDLGFDWARDESQRSRLTAWPVTIFIQGDDDPDVSPSVCEDVVQALGREKAKLCLAKGRAHLFEKTSYVEDTDEGMDAVRHAIDELDKSLASV